MERKKPQANLRLYVPSCSHTGIKPLSYGTFLDQHRNIATLDHTGSWLLITSSSTSDQYICCKSRTRGESSFRSETLFHLVFTSLPIVHALFHVHRVFVCLAQTLLPKETSTHATISSSPTLTSRQTRLQDPGIMTQQQ